MVEEKDVDNASGNEDGEDAPEKKAPRKRWNKKRNKYEDRYTSDGGDEEKFEGACDEMKKKVFSIGRNQADNFSHTHKMLQVVLGTKYTSNVSAAVKDYKETPTKMKAPVKPVLADLKLAGKVDAKATVVPDNLTDIYKEKVKTYSRLESKFEQDCESAFSLVIGQCSPLMISELKCHDEFDAISDEYNLVKLLLLIKKICFNYKTQDDPLHAIIKAQAALYGKKQGKDESVEDYALAVENRLTVLTALGGTVLCTGVRSHVAESEHQTKYENLNAAGKKACDITAIERVTAMLLFTNADEERFGKLQKEIHNDHLKVQKEGSSSAYQQTIPGVLRLFNSHSEVQKKPKKGKKTETEIAFAQGEGERQTGYGFRKGKCNHCGEDGHHQWECPKKKNTDSSKKKEEDDARTPTEKPSGGKNETANATHGSVQGDTYDSGDDFDDVQFHFATVETSIVPSSGSEVITGELNQTEMELVFGTSSSTWSPIPEDWVILDNQSTVNVFRNKKYLRNIRQVDTHVVIRCNAGSRTTNWVGDFPGFPEPVWYDPGGIANIISFDKAEKFYKIRYDSESGNGFMVTHRQNGSVRCFHKSRKGLFYIDMKQRGSLALVTTVEDNESKYTKCAVRKAKQARRLQDVTGVSAHDLEIAKMAEDIFGPSVAGVRGKTVRRLDDVDDDAQHNTNITGVERGESESDSNYSQSDDDDNDSNWSMPGLQDRAREDSSSDDDSDGGDGPPDEDHEPPTEVPPTSQSKRQQEEQQSERGHERGTGRPPAGRGHGRGYERKVHDTTSVPVKGRCVVDGSKQEMDEDDVKDPPNNSGGGKNETINTTHVTGLEKMVKESKIPIKRSWVLIDNQSTVNQMDDVVINVNNNSTGVGGRELDTIDDDYGDMPDLVELETMDDNSEVSRSIKQEVKVSSSKENEADGFTRPLKGKKIELGQNGKITGVPVDYDDGGDNDVPDMILPDEGKLERLLYSASELGKTLRNDEEKNTFVGWLENQGFVMNDDNCSMSKLIKEKKCTMFWHVNDIKVSHAEQVVVDEITSKMTDGWKRQKEGRE